MTTIHRNYPLVEERVLGPAPGRRFLSRPARSPEELPRIAAHQVLVYRTGDQYLTDHGLRGPHDEAVLSAGSVTVVDCRTAVPVTVDAEAPSSETDGFTVQVAFPCTVTDPVAVVREGLTDLESRLLGYLRSLPGLSDVTQEWPLEAGKEVARRLTARLVTYLEMEPPRIAGLAVGEPYLTVLTPEEFAAQQRRADEERRERERDRVQEAVRRERERMEHERARMEHERSKERERMEAERKALELRHQQELEDMRRAYTHQTEAEDQHYAHGLKSKENDFVRGEARKDLDEFGTDPALTEILALQRGELTYSELADRQRAGDQLRRERRLADEERRWEFDARMSQQERDDLRYRLERDDRYWQLEREERLAALEAAREERRETAAREREDLRRRLAEEREDKLAAREEQRRRAERRDQINQELGRQMINRGLLDNAPLDARAFVERLSTGQGLLDQEPPAAGQVAGADAPQLEEGESGQLTGSGDGRTREPAPAADDRDRDGEDDAADGPEPRPTLTADDDLGEAGREERGR
jgi:hypothetical protein